MSEQRKIPSPPESVECKEFWEGCNAEKLMIPRCKDTNQFYWYPRNLSPFTLTDNIEWVEASGKATLYSHSTLRRAKPPYCLAFVTLEEGVTIMTNIVDADFDALEIGQAMQLAFYETENGQKVPVFKPAA